MFPHTENLCNMRIALAQINLHVGNFEHNRNKILKAIRQARDKKANLVVFPELTVCGYPPLDMLQSEAFIDKCLDSVALIAKECHGIGAVVGCPSRNQASGGKSLFNSAFLLSDGQIRFVYNKGLLPTYDVFNEYRYFEPARQFSTIVFAGKRIAITLHTR